MSNYTPSPLTGDLAAQNAENEKIAAAIASQLDRNPDVGQSNQMETELDMNSNKITNLAAPESDNDAARKKDLEEVKTVVVQGADFTVQTISDLRTTEPTTDGQVAFLVQHTQDGKGGGNFYYDGNDTTSSDNNGTVIVTTGGARWKRELDGYVTPEMYGALSVANDTTAVQAAINSGIATLITANHTVDTISLIDNSHLIFSQDGKFNGTVGNQILDADNKSDLIIENPVLEGVYATTPNLSEHGIKFDGCFRVTITNPRISNVGGNGIQLNNCIRTYVSNIDIVNTGFIGFVGVDCTKSTLTGGYVQDAADAFSVQQKGGRECVIKGIEVINPNSCGIIVNTNQDSSRTARDCAVVDCVISGTDSVPPSSGTKAMIFMQAEASTVRGCTCRNNTESIGAGIACSDGDITLIGNTVTGISAIGIDVSATNGRTTLLGNKIENCQDRGFRQLGGSVLIGAGNSFIANALVGTVPNMDVVAADSFSMFGSIVQTLASGATLTNLRLQAGSYPINVSGNTFFRVNGVDIKSTTDELRTDLTGTLSIHSNGGAFVQVSTGWLANFEIKDRLLQFEDYGRTTLPVSGTWLQGDKMQNSAPIAGGTVGFICVTGGSPGTWKNWGDIQA